VAKDIDEIIAAISAVKEYRQTSSGGELKLLLEVLELDILRTELKPVVIQPAFTDRTYLARRFPIICDIYQILEIRVGSVLMLLEFAASRWVTSNSRE